MKVFILGKIRGAYRTQQVIKSLLDVNDIQLSFIGFDDATISRFSNRISRLIYGVQAILLMPCCDVVFIPAMQHDTVLIKIAKFLKKKIIVDYYISYYDTFVLDRKELKKKSFKAQRLYKRDRYALLNADKCLFLNNAEKEYYCKVVNVKTDDIKAEVVPLVVSEKKQAHMDYFMGKSNVMKLCWTGSYIPLQGLDKIIKMMLYVKEEHLNCHLYIWGDTDIKAAPYIKLIKENHLEEYITVHNEWGNLEAWENFIVNNCDVCMGIFGDSEKAKTVCANKVVDGVAFGTPVITAYSKGAEEFFENNKGVYFTKNTPEDIFNAVHDLYFHKESISEGLNSAKSIYKEIFSIKSFENHLRNVFEMSE